MASFMVSLWESIFTPGPTPTLLIATNATFGALQLLLVILLYFTRSIHFFILSVLCGGLWYAINWFATEVAAAKVAEDEASKKDKRQISPDPTGSDTETETEHKGGAVSTAADLVGPGASDRKRPPKAQPGAAAMPPPTARPAPTPAQTSTPPATSIPHSSPVPSGQGDSSHLSPSSAQPSHGAEDTATTTSGAGRRRSVGDSSGYVSTDSEWEKVSEGESGK